jgi:hypothetical protein
MKKQVKLLDIFRFILLTIVLVEIIALTFLMTNKIIELKGRVDKLETQIVELKGDK